MKNYFNLQGKTALVTGASSGLGRRFVEVLSDAGCRVIASGRNEARLRAVCSHIEQQGGQATPLVMDVSSEENIHQALADLNNQPIDILINNAGIAEATPIEILNNPSWQKQLNTNLLGPWALIQAVSQCMIMHKIKGSIINIASINGDALPYAGFSAYCASKAGLIQLGKQLVGELSPHGIRVNTIVPGLVKTELTQDKIEQAQADYEAKIPLSFIAEPSDLDAAILFLSSDQASAYVTGSCLTIDGGLSANCNTV